MPTPFIDYHIDCGCKKCTRPLRQGNRQRNNSSDSGWTPRTVGSIDGDDVTFRQGTGDNEGQTLIADGQPSGRAFDGRRKQHNHYGPKREGGGRFNEDRGHYTGPGA